LVRYIAERYLRRPFGWRALAIAVNS